MERAFMFRAHLLRSGQTSVKSSITKHSVVVRGRKTSISLEEAFWRALREIAAARGESLSQRIASIDADRQFANLSSAIRLFVLGYYKDRLARPHTAPEQRDAAG
jgi:predicted DNA-binding ribbon-helix-helix protein